MILASVMRIRYRKARIVGRRLMGSQYINPSDKSGYLGLLYYSGEVEKWSYFSYVGC